MKETINEIKDLSCMLTFEYDQYMKMMCVYKDKPKVKGNLCVSFGTSNLKGFLAMKRNVKKWFTSRTNDEQGRILKFIQANC